MKIPKYRRNGDGRAFAEYPRSGGKREYFGVYGTPEADEAYRQWLSKVLDGSAQPVVTIDRLTVESVAVQYLSHMQQKLSDTEYQTYYRMMQFVVDRKREKHPSSVTSLFLTTLLSELAQKPVQRGKNENNRHKYTRKYLNRALSIWKRWFRWLAQHQIIQMEIYSSVSIVDPLQHGQARESRTVEPVPVASVLAIKPHVSPVIYDMMQVQYLCGMRPQDVCRLRFSEIDTSGEVWLFRPEKHKTAHRGKKLSKAIPLPAQEIIAKHRPQLDTEYVFRPLAAFTSRNVRIAASTRQRLGDFYSPQSYSQAIRLGCKRAGIPHFGANQLRHAIATELFSTIGIEASQSYLGHSSTNMTDRYAQKNEQTLTTVAKHIVNPFNVDITSASNNE